MPTPRTFVLRRENGDAKALVSLPKNPPLRDESYRRWVATLACAHCNRHGPSQCAHADQGKGERIKSGDDTCFPLCPICHEGIGQKAWFQKAQRRYLEDLYGSRTRLQALSEDKFPTSWTNGMEP
jgi:hypothetical protein